MQQPPNNQPPPYGNQPSGNQPQYGGQPPANQPPPYGAPPQYGNQPPQYGSQQQYGQSPFGGPPLDVQPQEENDKLIAALAYIICPLLGIIVLLTDMKNKPMSKPLNGSMLIRTSWRYSVSASSKPARNAPRAIDRPAR